MPDSVEADVAPRASAPDSVRASRTIELDEAADTLGVSPATLRAWEHRYGYPRSSGGRARPRSYRWSDISALRMTMQTALSLVSAINRARAVASAQQWAAGELRSDHSR